MPHRPVRLVLEPLEVRTVPNSTPIYSDSFDQSASGGLPEHWQSWGSQGESGFAVSSDRGIGSGSLISSGNSSLAGRAWLNGEQPADVSVSAAVYADSLIPIEVLARGGNLDGLQPTYYAVSIVRGVEIKLLKVENGTATELKSLKTSTYLSGQWLDVTLTVQGDTIQARVQQRDSGKWLTPSGEWDALASAALTVRDSAIRTAGQVGFSRPATFAGSVAVDELRITEAKGDITSPLVNSVARPVSRPVRPAYLAGIVRFVAGIREAGRVTRVEYLVDGELVARKATRFHTHDFDSRNVSNGIHQLMIRVWDEAGNVGEASRNFAVHNLPPFKLPAIPRHYDHIRYASLAYNGLVISDDEAKLLRESVDLVVPHSRYLPTINGVSPGTPQLIYSNVSNLYLDLLTDWLAYADRTRRPRESAFYHVAQPTPFVGDSSSSMPVTWFWNVQSGPLAGEKGFDKLTSHSQTAKDGDVSFPSAGKALYIGHPDRFREINLQLPKGAGAGWSAVIEYPASVGSVGRPAVWKRVPIVSDGTDSFRQTGAITFDPPRDWKAALVAGSTAKLFYVRIHVTAGDASAAPVASTMLGRDYVGANGKPSGVIPAFDAAADRNRDGYLNDAEYADRRDGFDARFFHETRLFYPYYGQMRFLTNPSGAGVAAWAATYHRLLIRANLLADGIFMDNSGGRVAVDGAELVESMHSYASDFGSLLGVVNRAIAPRWILANTAGGGSGALRVARHVPGTIEEFAMRPLAHNWSQFRDLADTVSRRLAVSDPSGFFILDSLSQGGSPTDPRTQMAALSYYYLLADPQSTFFMTWGGEEPASDWSRHWFDAITFDVGQPTESLGVFAIGTDHANPALAYYVFQRRYENALVLYKPLSYSPGKGTGGTGNGTATIHPLDGRYRQLRSDGTLSKASSTVKLRNGEGAILIPAGSGPEA